MAGVLRRPDFISCPYFVPRRRDQRHRRLRLGAAPCKQMARLALWALAAAAVMPTAGGHATAQTPLAKGQPRARLPRRLEGYSARRLADEDDWTDGPAGFCDGDEAELGETASREDCIDTCDDAGYEAMTWDTISTTCYCFIEEWCDCIDEYDAEDEWCWCGEKDGFEPEEMSESECAAAGCEYESGSEDGGWTECNCEEAMCASAGGEWQCEAYGPMAFKGFPPPEVCGYSSYSYSYSYDPFMPCPDLDSAYLTCVETADDPAAASAGLGWSCCDIGTFPTTCSGMQTYSEFQDACGDPAPECAAEWTAYVECVYAEILDEINNDLYGTAPLECDLNCNPSDPTPRPVAAPAPTPLDAALKGSDAAAARGPFFAATAALLGAATALAR